MKTNNNEFQWKTITGGIVLVLISLFFVYISEYVTGSFLKNTDNKDIPQPNITIEGIQENKGSSVDRLIETEKMKRISLYAKPLETPTFVSDTNKLTKYLESNTAGVVINGEISEAYLYIKVKSLDVINESIYFWIVDGSSEGGHLIPTENLAIAKGNEFLYDLTKIPLVQKPYSISREPKFVNIVDLFLNRDLEYKTRREYFIGSFVSTTKLPNQVEILEVRYNCKQGINCSINSI